MEDRPLSKPPDTPGRRLTPIHQGPSSTPGKDSPISKITHPDLATRAADMVDSVVDIVRGRVVRPVERAATYVILSVFSLFAGTVFLILISIGLFRLLMMILNLVPGGPHEWAAYLIMAGIFLAAGLLVMRKRRNIRPIEGDSD